MIDKVRIEIVKVKEIGKMLKPSEVIPRMVLKKLRTLILKALPPN